MVRILSLALIIGAVQSAALCRAVQAEDKQPTGQQQSQPAQAVDANAPAYLGLGVAPVDPALASQLSELLGDGQGVLIVEVVKGSPADNAGLKANDVLVSYDDQKVNSPSQLVKQVRSDKPGRDVGLSFIRNGKIGRLLAKLGLQPKAGTEQTHTALKPATPGQSRTPEEIESMWQTFDALTLTRTGDNHYRAEIRFRDAEGKVEARTFEGTREELRKSIMAEKNLPANERDHLLRALDAADQPLDLSLPGIGIRPSGLFFDDELER